MSKCRIIDRLPLTKGELKIVGETEKQPETTDRGEKCPICGQMTLQHAEGCETCYACGYSKCLIGW